MTVNMYRSQQQGRRGQRIDTRLTERQSQNKIVMGEVKLVACFLGKRWLPLAFSRCGVQGKVTFLLGFGFMVSLLFYFVRTH